MATPKPAKKIPKKTASKRANQGVKKPNGAGASADEDVWNLRLYVAGDSPRSRTALENLRKLCDTHLGGRKYNVEVIDLMKKPGLAKADQIFALPTLIRNIPEPVKRVIGDLSNADRAIIALELT